VESNDEWDTKEVHEECIVCIVAWQKAPLGLKNQARSLSHCAVNYENVAFFCGQCLPDVPKALALYNIYSKLDIEFEKKFCAMESELQKGIGHHLAKCFKAANLVALEKPL